MSRVSKPGAIKPAALEVKMLKAQIRPHGGIHPDSHKQLTSQNWLLPCKRLGV